MRAHAKVAPLRIDVGGLEPSSSVVIKTSEATSDPSVILLTWPEGGFAVAQPESFTRRLPPAPRSHGQQKRRGGEPCTCSSGVMGMLRVDPVADHGEGLWSAARDDHGAWLRPKKQGPDRQKVAA